LEAAAYLNHAAISPLNARATAAIARTAQRFAAEGLKAWTEGNEIRTRLRGHIATLIGCAPIDIALTGNTSQGMVWVANEYPWQRGDGLVLVRGEFPGNVVPWLAVARRFELQVHWLDLADLAEETPHFHEVMERRPRLMAISWVQYQTGYTQPLEDLSALRQRYGIHICLDAIQGLGPRRLDLGRTPFDFVVCGGHKWLLSPEGTGFLYVHPERMPAMEPTVVGWISQADAASFLFKGAGFVDYEGPLKSGPSRYEFATMNTLGYAGMEASLALLIEVGPAHVEKTVLQRAEKCRAALCDMGYSVCLEHADSGNVCLPMPAPRLLAFARALDERGISVATPDGHLRAAPHFYNDDHEIDLFLEAMQEYRDHPPVG
jgi:selenocysteine lyase/cysteine desulfurase